MDTIERIAKLERAVFTAEVSEEEARSMRSQNEQLPWHRQHSHFCGGRFRGCAPWCPKEVWETHGVWIGQGPCPTAEERIPEEPPPWEGKEELRREPDCDICQGPHRDDHPAHLAIRIRNLDSRVEARLNDTRESIEVLESKLNNGLTTTDRLERHLGKLKRIVTGAGGKRPGLVTVVDNLVEAQDHYAARLDKVAAREPSPLEELTNSVYHLDERHQQFVLNANRRLETLEAIARCEHSQSWARFQPPPLEATEKTTEPPKEYVPPAISLEQGTPIWPDDPPEPPPDRAQTPWAALEDLLRQAYRSGVSEPDPSGGNRSFEDGCIAAILRNRAATADKAVLAVRIPVVGPVTVEGVTEEENLLPTDGPGAFLPPPPDYHD